MQGPDLVLYQSAELASDSNIYIDFVHEASALGAKRIYHYHAIPNAFKGIEPHIALLDLNIAQESRFETPPKSPKITVRTSQSVSILNPPSTEQSGDPWPPSRLFDYIQDSKIPSLPRAMEDDLPQGDGKDLLPWSDDDVDATDYKNMPDYDPWQDNDSYESTPELEATAKPLIDLSLDDKSCIRRYIMLHRKENSERASQAEEIPGRRFASSRPQSHFIITLHKPVPSVRKNRYIP